MIKIRKSKERGFVDHGWLKSYHSFSFSSYYDPKHMHFGNLRVINEDFIAPEMGFGKHPHSDMEIITYVISGALKHQDSMGNSSIILPGEFQTMSAGTGVMHSEFSVSKTETHLLQIWILPKEKRIEPSYNQKSFAELSKNQNLTLVVSGDGKDDSIKINQDVELFLGKFPQKAELEIKQNNNKIWIQLIKGSLLVNNIEIESGDALAIQDEPLSLLAKSDSEFLLFNL